MKTKRTFLTWMTTAFIFVLFGLWGTTLRAETVTMLSSKSGSLAADSKSITWSQDGVTLVLGVGTNGSINSSNITIGTFQAYRKNEITITITDAQYKLSGVEFTYSGSKHGGTDMTFSDGTNKITSGVTTSNADNKLTITLSTAVSQLVIVNPNTQIQSNGDAVFTLTKVGGEDPAPETVAAPTFSPAEGSFTEAQNVTITSTTTDAVIYYTIDGTDPTTESTLYTAAIPVSATTTIKAIATKSGMNNSTVASATYTINAGGSSTDFTLVTDASQLKVGDDILIVGKASSTYYTCDNVIEGKNNRKGTVVSVSGDAISTIPSDATVFELKEGKKASTYAFYDAGNNGYLYAASSGSNHMKTETTLSDNSSFTISVSGSGSPATIKAQGTNTHNTIRFNDASNQLLFSCYGSGQKDVWLYRRAGAPKPSIVVPEAPVAIGAIYSGTKTGSVDVLTDNLTDDITLTLDYANAADRQAFEITAPATKTIAKTEESATVTVKYTHPGTAGNDSVKLVLTSGSLVKEVWIKAESKVCSKPGVVVSAKDKTTATLTVTGASANYCNYTYKATSAAVWSEDVMVENGAISLTSLTAGTEYQVKVWNECVTNTVYSDTNTVTFTTVAADSKTLNFEAGFAANTKFEGQVSIPFTTDATLGTETGNYKVKVTIAGAATQTDYATQSPYTAWLASGNYTVVLELVNQDNTSLATPVSTGDPRAFSVDLPDLTATITFAPDAGTYNEAKTVSVTCSDAAATLQYRTAADGEWQSIPAGGIPVNKNMTVYAQAVKDHFDAATAQAAYVLQVAKPVIGPDADVRYTGKVENVTITCAGADKIYYTTDGSTPTVTSTEYTAAFELNGVKLHTVKAIGVKADWTNSEMATAKYKVLAPKPEGLAFYETFDYVDGSAPSWSGDITDNINDYADNIGWTGAKVYKGPKAVRMGTTSALGSITTPEIDLSSATDGVFYITCKLGVWEHNKEKTSINVVCGDYTHTVTGLPKLTTDEKPELMETRTFMMKNGSANAKIIFTAIDAEYNRFMLDSVCVYTTKPEGINFTSLSVSPANKALTYLEGEQPEAEISVSGADLQGDVTMTVTQKGSDFTVTPGSPIAKADAENGVTVKVKYTGNNDFDTVTLKFTTTGVTPDKEVKVTVRKVEEQGALANLKALRALYSTYEAAVEYEVSGDMVVTHKDPNNFRVWVQDIDMENNAGASMLLFKVGSTNYASVAVGDVIGGMKGKLSKYQNLLELIPDSTVAFNVKEHNHALHVDTLTIAALKANLTDWQSALVCIEGLVFKSTTGNFTHKGSYTLKEDVGSAEVTLYADYETADYMGDPFPTAKLNMTGMVGQYGTGLQFTPRSKADIVEAGEALPALDVTLTISPEEIMQTGSVEVTITCSDQEAEIYYTTDGSNPTKQSTKYNNAAFTLTTSCTVKAVAAKEGYALSEVASRQYVIRHPENAKTYTKITTMAELGEGGRFLLVQEDSSLVMSNFQSSNNRQSVKVEITSGAIVTEVADFEGTKELQMPAEITIAKVEGGYTLYDAVQALYFKYTDNDKNYLQLDKTGASYTWAISFEDGNAVIKAGGNAEYMIRCNTGNKPALFSCYKGTQKPVQLYKEDIDDGQPAITAVAALSMRYKKGEEVSAEINVRGRNLTGEAITVQVEGEGFNVSPATISVTEGSATGVVTVKYNGSAAEKATATVTYTCGETTATTAVTALEKPVYANWEAMLADIDFAKLDSINQNEVIEVSGKMIVTCVDINADKNQNKIWVQDENLTSEEGASMLLFKQGKAGDWADVKEGDEITGISCTVNPYHGLIEVKPTAALNITGNGKSVKVLDAKAADITLTSGVYHNALVKLSGLNYEANSIQEGDQYEAGQTYAAYDADDTEVAVYAGLTEADFYGSEIELKEFDLLAIVTIYDGAVQFVPRKSSDIIIHAGGEVEPPVAVEDAEGVVFSVYPNPNSGRFCVNVAEDAHVAVFAANGTLVAARRVAAGISEFNLAQAGVYFVRVAAGEKVSVKRVVVR